MDDLDRIVISQLVDLEQEVLRLKDENRELKESKLEYLELFIKNIKDIADQCEENNGDVGVKMMCDFTVRVGEEFIKSTIESINGNHNG